MPQDIELSEHLLRIRIGLQESRRPIQRDAASEKFLTILALGSYTITNPTGRKTVISLVVDEKESKASLSLTSYRWTGHFADTLATIQPNGEISLQIQPGGLTEGELRALIIKLANRLPRD